MRNELDLEVAIQTAARALFEHQHKGRSWGELVPGVKASWRASARAAIEAGLPPILEASAREIEAELVCCDIHERLEVARPQAGRAATRESSRDGPRVAGAAQVARLPRHVPLRCLVCCNRSAWCIVSLTDRLGIWQRQTTMGVPLQYRIKHLFSRCRTPRCWRAEHHQHRCCKHVRDSLTS